MGGIASLADRSGTLDPRAIRRMTDALRQRGPDDEGCLAVSDEGRRAIGHGGADSQRPLPPISAAAGAAAVLLGHRRLAGLDLSPAGRQPMANRSRDRWMVYNGEFYHFPGLRLELEAAGALAHRPRVEYPALMAELSGFGVGVCPLLPIKKYERNVPIKNFDGRAGGLPVLTSNLGNVGRYLELSGGGIAIDPTSYEAFEQAILRLFDPEVRQELADRGRKFIEGTGGFSCESEAYAAVTENAVARSHAAAADRQHGDPVWRRRDHGECASGGDDGTRVRSGGRGGTV